MAPRFSTPITTCRLFLRPPPAEENRGGEGSVRERRGGREEDRGKERKEEKREKKEESK